MKIYVFSEDKMYDALIKGKIDNSVAIISYGDNPRDHVSFDYYRVPLDLFLVNFQDLDYCDADEEDLIELFYQANELAQYIKQKISEGKDIICQCYEGVSRSSATAWAISEYIGQKYDYENDPHYQPNRFIYETLSKLLDC